MQTEQIVRPGPTTNQQVGRFQGIDADPKALPFQFLNAFGQMRKRRFRQTAQIDDIGAGCLVIARPVDNFSDAKARRIDDFGENVYPVAG